MKFQNDVALSSTETEHIALSTTIQETALMTHLLRELSAVMDVPECRATMKHTVFEDNNGALELAKGQKMRPITKHIAIKYHHSRDFLAK